MGRWSSSSRAAGPCTLPTVRPLLLCRGLHSPVTQVLRNKFSSAEAKPFSSQLPGKTHPSVLGRHQLLFPASTAQGSWAVAVHMQINPTLAHTPSFCIFLFCRLNPSASILRGELHPWNGATLFLILDVRSLYTASLTASSQPMSSIFCNVKLLNKYDECPLPCRAMPKTVSRSLTAKVILFVKKKGKQYH